jgi:hypothetical protein
LTGLTAGSVVNIVLWVWFDPAISWLWWSLTGAAGCFAVGLTTQWLAQRSAVSLALPIEPTATSRRTILVLGFWTVLTLALLAGIGPWLWGNRP